MATCSYCDQPATMSIIAIPAEVCDAHAREFWTGLLAFAHDRSGPCVKLEGRCDCPLCLELTAEQERKLTAARLARSPAEVALAS